MSLHTRTLLSITALAVLAACSSENSPNAATGRFGNRKPPSAAYAGDSPILHLAGTTWVGGMFWDGRATGWILGDPLAEQAQGPFLNPLEQNNASAQVVIDKVLVSNY